MTFLPIAALLLTALLALPADADDTSPNSYSSGSSANDKLAPARAQIGAKNWAGAVRELKAVNDPGNADWNNLMGFSLRKLPNPDLAVAERHYNEALRLDPSHRGALEYSGELYLMMGDLARAEQRLAQLDKACRLGCDEYTKLKQTVARYKAAGNKHVAAP